MTTDNNKFSIIKVKPGAAAVDLPSRSQFSVDDGRESYAFRVSDGARIIIWDRNPAHPGNGEIFITSASGPTAVAETDKIRDLLIRGLLEKC